MNDKLKNVVVTIAFVFIIVIFFIANIIKKDDTISIAERRKLEQFPQISAKTVFNGTFFNKFNKYTTDQFVQREEFRKLKINAEFKLLRKSDYNNLYQYGDYIISQTYPLNEKSVLNISKKINQIYEQYLTDQNNVYFTIVPDKNYFINFQGTYSGQLPISTAKDKIKILTNSEIEKSKVYNYETKKKTRYTIWKK